MRGRLQHPCMFPTSMYDTMHMVQPRTHTYACAPVQILDLQVVEVLLLPPLFH